MYAYKIVQDNDICPFVSAKESFESFPKETIYFCENVTFYQIYVLNVHRNLWKGCIHIRYTSDIIPIYM